MKPTEQQLLQAYEQAPQAVQDSLTDGSAIDFIDKLVPRYRLHVDVAGLATETIRDTLLGLTNPNEFVSQLTAIGMEQATAEQLTADLNAEVFIPLRDALRANGTTPTSLSRIPSVPRPEVGQGSRYPAGPVAPTPSLPPEDSRALAASPNLLVRTMATDQQAVMAGTTPVPVAVPPHIPTPARSFQTSSIPSTALSAPSPIVPAEVVAPIAIPNTPPTGSLAAPVAVTPPPVAPETESVAARPAQTAAHTDPYREPIEG